MARTAFKQLEVVAALRDGFSGEAHVSSSRGVFYVTPHGFDDPITVRRDGIDVPDSYPAELVAGIRLDCQAIHA